MTHVMTVFGSFYALGLATPAMIESETMLRPKRRYDDWNLDFYDSPKRPRESPNTFNADWSSPETMGAWINSATASPLPPLDCEKSRDDGFIKDTEEPTSPSDAFFEDIYASAMVCDPVEDYKDNICYGAVSNRLRARTILTVAPLTKENPCLQRFAKSRLSFNVGPTPTNSHKVGKNSSTYLLSIRIEDMQYVQPRMH